MAIRSNTRACSKTPGMERPHAEAVAKLQAQTVKDLIDHELVTRDHLKSELESQELKLRDEIRGETAKLRDEIRDLKDDFRRELNNESTALRRHIDGVTIQIRALRVGGAIAAFAISAVVLLSRVIR